MATPSRTKLLSDFNHEDGYPVKFLDNSKVSQERRERDSETSFKQYWLAILVLKP